MEEPRSKEDNNSLLQLEKAYSHIISTDLGRQIDRNSDEL
jgi:hypothetical protein